MRCIYCIDNKMPKIFFDLLKKVVVPCIKLRGMTISYPDNRNLYSVNCPVAKYFPDNLDNRQRKTNFVKK